MGREVVGLKIGASGLTAARIAVNGAPRLVAVASASLEPGIVSGGEVRDPGRLADALKAFFAANKLPRKNVRVGVANNRIGVRTIDLAGVGDAKQLANAIRFRAQEALPIPLDEAVLDYQVLADGVDAEGTATKRVLFVVAYRDLVERYAESCKRAGLRLLGIDLEAFALVRALAPLAEAVEDGETDGRGALVAVSIGAERSTLAVSDGLTCEFTRILDWGGASLTAALAVELGIEEAEAERLKIEVGLHADSAPEGLTADWVAQVRKTLVLGVQGFARELVASLQFYQSQPGSLGIREIALAGGTARMDGLAEVLERMVGVAVRIGDPLVNLAAAKKIKGGEPDPSLAIAIGLGMGS